MSNTLAVIPARGGSKSLPKKNILPLLGRPLIGWSIEAASQADLIDRFVVSTEDEEIASIARDEGAEVLKRPIHLAQDNSTTLSVLQHVLEQIDATTVVVLQPTSPIRVNRLTDRAIQRFFDTGADSLATGHMLTDLEWGSHNNLSRQDVPGFFHDDGNIYVHRAEILREGRWTGEVLEKMVVESYYNLEIDDKVDLWAVEGVMCRVLDFLKST